MYWQVVQKPTTIPGPECNDYMYAKYFYRATRMHSTDWRGKMSVHPSIRNMPVLCLNDYTYPESFFTIG